MCMSNENEKLDTKRFDDLLRSMGWKEIAPEKKDSNVIKKLETKFFKREDVTVISEGNGCEGVSIVEWDGDRFRIEERPSGKGFVVATSRNKRIFKCLGCGGLDAVDKCRFCGSTNIVVFLYQGTSSSSEEPTEEGSSSSLK